MRGRRSTVLSITYFWTGQLRPFSKWRLFECLQPKCCASDSLILVDYEKGAYVQKDIIKTEDVRCIGDHDGQNFYIFKDQLAVSVIPYTEVHRSLPVNNPGYRAKALKMLLSNGQPYLTGDAVTFTRETGKKDYSVHNISAPSGPIPIVVGTEVREVFSPCSEGKP